MIKHSCDTCDKKITDKEGFEISFGTKTKNIYYAICTNKVISAEIKYLTKEN